MEPLKFNPFKDFIGKTIENINYFKGRIDIYFTDGTNGYIDASVPIGTKMSKVFLSGKLNKEKE